MNKRRLHKKCRENAKDNNTFLSKRFKILLNKNIKQLLHVRHNSKVAYIVRL